MRDTIFIRHYRYSLYIGVIETEQQLPLIWKMLTLYPINHWRMQLSSTGIDYSEQLGISLGTLCNINHTYSSIKETNMVSDLSSVCACFFTLFNTVTFSLDSNQQVFFLFQGFCWGVWSGKLRSWGWSWSITEIPHLQSLKQEHPFMHSF